jgi:hypothetical protein
MTPALISYSRNAALGRASFDGRSGINTGAIRGRVKQASLEGASITSLRRNALTVDTEMR